MTFGERCSAANSRMSLQFKRRSPNPLPVCSEFICQWHGHECTRPLVILKPIPGTYAPDSSFINSLLKHCARHWSS